MDGFRFVPDTTPAVSLLCMVGGIIYTCTVGYVVFSQNQRLAAARDELKRSEERYRLIAENADDLVAMLDAGGRWIYPAPRTGASSTRRTSRRAATRSRQLPLRLVDREGRMRQYSSHLQPVERNFLLVSHDVTDLRESEERMLFAAHALEGMTEAIGRPGTPARASIRSSSTTRRSPPPCGRATGAARRGTGARTAPCTANGARSASCATRPAR